MGSIMRRTAAKIDFSDYEKLTCPNCRGITIDCSTCNGEGSISREKALEMQ